MKVKVTSKLTKKIHFFLFLDDLLIYDFCTLQLICVIFIFYTLDSTMRIKDARMMFAWAAICNGGNHWVFPLLKIVIVRKSIEFAVSQMRLQLTKSVIFAGVCCFVSQLSTFHSEHYLLFSCKEKVNIWGKRKIFP